VRRIYTYPQVPKSVVWFVQYGGLLSSLIVFWIGVTFPSQLKNASNNLSIKFFTTSSKIRTENICGPYSDALARNFLATIKTNVDKSTTTKEYNKQYEHRKNISH
jgi:hypothetical protein